MSSFLSLDIPSLVVFMLPWRDQAEGPYTLFCILDAAASLDAFQLSETDLKGRELSVKCLAK